MGSEKKNSELEVNRGEKHELVVNPFVKKKTLLRNLNVRHRI